MFEVARFNMKVNKFILISALLLVTRVQIIASLASQCKISSLSPKFNVVSKISSKFCLPCILKKDSKSFALSSTLNRCDQYAETIVNKPRWGGPILGPIIRYLNVCVIAGLFFFILRIMNKFTTVRKELLTDKIFNREKGRGLLTVSNHQSMADDPGLFSAMTPWWRISSRRMRWVLCTEDVFFFVSEFFITTPIFLLWPFLLSFFASSFKGCLLLRE